MGPRFPSRAWCALLLFAAFALQPVPPVSASPRSDASIVAPAIAIGLNPLDPPGSGPALTDYVSAAGAAPSIVMWFQTWSEPLFYESQLAAVDQVGARPMITWLPEASGVDGADGSADFSLARIAAGDFDPYVRASARQAAAYGKSMLIRFAHEMNSDWYPWGSGVAGNRPEDYIAAWRHVVSVFRQEGATNVRWVWSPNVVSASGTGATAFENLYPGDEYVDWLALDGYNYPKAGRLSLAQLFAPSYERLVAMAPTKPVMIAETATAQESGDKGSWITEGFLRQLPVLMPRIRAAVWFDRQKEYDWRLDSSASSFDAWRQVVASPQFAPAYDATEPPPVVASITPTTLDADTVTLRADIGGPSAGLTYRWDFGDGKTQVVTADGKVDHAFSRADRYTVSLQAVSPTGVPSAPVSRVVVVDTTANAGTPTDPTTVGSDGSSRKSEEAALDCVRMKVVGHTRRSLRVQISCDRALSFKLSVRVIGKTARTSSARFYRISGRTQRVHRLRIAQPRRPAIAVLRVGDSQRRVRLRLAHPA